MKVSERYSIPENEIEYQAIRAGGPGGQHVNKTSSAVHLRFDLHGSSLPEIWRERLLKLQDRRISSDGVIVIKASSYRSQDKNRGDAQQRLLELIQSVMNTPRKRRPTRPSRGARQRRMDAKKQRSQTKSLRGKTEF